MSREQTGHVVKCETQLFEVADELRMLLGRKRMTSSLYDMAQRLLVVADRHAPPVRARPTVSGGEGWEELERLATTAQAVHDRLRPDDSEPLGWFPEKALRDAQIFEAGEREYIAAASPQTVLALIAVARGGGALREQARSVPAGGKSETEGLLAALDVHDLQGRKRLTEWAEAIIRAYGRARPEPVLPETSMAVAHLSDLLSAEHLSGDYPIAGMGSVSWDDLRIILTVLLQAENSHQKALGGDEAQPSEPNTLPTVQAETAVVGDDTERMFRQADRLNNGLPGSLDYAAEKLFKAEYPDRDYWSIKPDARISWHRKAWEQAPVSTGEQPGMSEPDTDCVSLLADLDAGKDCGREAAATIRALIKERDAAPTLPDDLLSLSEAATQGEWEAAGSSVNRAQGGALFKGWHADANDASLAAASVNFIRTLAAKQGGKS